MMVNEEGWIERLIDLFIFFFSGRVWNWCINLVNASYADDSVDEDHEQNRLDGRNPL